MIAPSPLERLRWTNLLYHPIAEGAITDLRARKLGGGAKARSLAGSPRDRGAIYPFGWDDIGDADTVDTAMIQ